MAKVIVHRRERGIHIPLPKIGLSIDKWQFTQDANYYDKVEQVLRTFDRNYLICGRQTDDNPHSLHFKQRINLTQDGSHFIRIVAENAKGAKVASTHTVVVGMDAIALSIDRKDYALLFAPDKYDHWDDLVKPVDDSRAIARELQEKYGFQTELVENADIEHVFEKLREYSQRRFRPQDQLLIFFAGHGTGF